VATDRVVIVGGSLAGASAARSLRRHGFSGEVLLIGQETHPPYSPAAADGRLVRGSVAERSFIIGYEESGRIVGGLAVNSPRDCRPRGTSTSTAPERET
jgi:NADPH-dependent 2,4-dienoyl-CoA reductase/sulfur reductase-like enzyme